MEYPQLNHHFPKEELIEHFTLTQEERFLLGQLRKDSNILGFAIILKSFLYLGYPPRKKEDIPIAIVSWIAKQLNLEPNLFKNYVWRDTLWDEHLASLRSFIGFRPYTTEDTKSLIVWLVTEAEKHSSRPKMFAAAIQRCRFLHLELPMEKVLQRLVSSAWQQYLNAVGQKIFERLSPEIRERMKMCLNTVTTEKENFDWMNGNPGKPGMKSLKREIKRLQFISGFEIDPSVHLEGIPIEVQRLLRDRAAPEGAYQLKRHAEPFRYALLTALLHYRRQEVTDNIVGIFLTLIHRIDTKTEKKLERDVVRDLPKVYKKGELLYKVAKVSTQNPDGIIESVLYPAVGKEVLEQIVQEFEGRELRYENTQAQEKKKKYKGFYRKMVKPVLETLTFRTNNPARQPLLDGIALIRKYLDKKHVHYPETENVPEELLTGVFREMAIVEDNGVSRVLKHYFELSVLQKLEKALKNKEVWVEGSFRYRNPDQDLPQDWAERRVNYCRKHQIPERAEDFLEPIREELGEALKKANEYFGQKRDVYIYYPGDGERGLFRIPKIVAGPDHPILQEIKLKALERWGILDLIDFLLEADRQVNFTRFFYSTAQRQVLTTAEVRERLLLSILGLGTGLGLKRIHAAARPSFSYEDLVYFNKRFMRPDSVREAIAALVNRILAVRSPEIWGVTTSCTSDGKHLGAWEQNLLAQWHPHYQECGFMPYFLVDRNSAGIHSQIKRGTEVGAMISALILHDTLMTVESNCVDSHGQSELGFAFCRFLRVELLPRLKRMKYERLYLPETATKDRYPNLAGVLARPIRMEQAYENYDDMVRHVVAAKERTAPVDSILRRFNRNNPAHPAYKGFLEVGKALKTIHDCKFLTEPSFRERIHGERNVVESWNSTVDFICYGGKAEISTNDPEVQELTVQCLHLLQNTVVLVNTEMLERVLYDDGFFPRMKADDLNAMTPLFTSNVNPYGDIRLDLNKPSFLEVH